MFGASIAYTLTIPDDDSAIIVNGIYSISTGSYGGTLYQTTFKNLIDNETFVNTGSTLVFTPSITKGAVANTIHIKVKYNSSTAVNITNKIRLNYTILNTGGNFTTLYPR